MYPMDKFIFNEIIISNTNIMKKNETFLFFIKFFYGLKSFVNRLKR